MTVDTMRTLDRYAGIPLCWIFGLLNNARTRPVKMSGVRTVLIVKFFGLGSILLTTPALQLIRGHFKGARVIYLTFEANVGLVHSLPGIDDVLTIRTSTPGAFLRDTARVIANLRRLRVDIVFDFEFFSKFSTLMAFFSGASVRVGFHLPTRWRTGLLNQSVPLNKNRHVTEAFCELVYAIGAFPSRPDICPPRIHEMDCAAVSEKLGLTGARFIVINVNSGPMFLERRWPPENFVRLIDQLARELDHRIVLIGSEEERNYVQAVVNDLRYNDRCINAAGRLTMGELLALLKGSSLVVSNDSGPLHLAAALGVPTVGLFGPESPAFYGQQNHRSRIIYKSISCSPCMNVYAAKTFRCPYEGRCMQVISPEEVRGAVLDLVRTV